jgi:hypothetical protein
VFQAPFGFKVLLDHDLPQASNGIGEISERLDEFLGSGMMFNQVLVCEIGRERDVIRLTATQCGSE